MNKSPGLNENIFIPTWIWMAIPAAFALVCGSYMVWHRIPGGYRILAVSAYPLLIASSYFLGTMLHEFGHFIVGKMSGLSMGDVTIGSGNVLWQFKLLDTNWKVLTSPFSHGYTQIYPWPQNGLRGKMIAMLVAGPLVNAALFAILWFPVYLDPDPLIQAFNQHRPYVLFIIPALTNLYLLGITLYPYVDKNGYASDGLQLLELARGIHPLFQTKTWQELKDSPDREDEILARAEELKQPGLPGDYRRFLLDEYATLVLLLDARAHLTEARSAAEELCREAPTNASAKATLGAVMIEQGEHAEGKRRLLEVMDADLNVHEKSIIAAYLALVEHHAGNKAAASDWLMRAAGFNPACLALKKIRGIIEPA